MADLEQRGSDQRSMWDGWHTRHVAVDDTALHIACRQDLLNALPQPSHCGPILELGSGQGFDAMAIAAAGYTVEALEFSSVAVGISRRNLAARDELHINYLCRDIAQPLPYPRETFSGIFSYLSLHYFNTLDTKKVFAEITRVAAPSSVFSFAVRSVEDPLFTKGRQLDHHLYDCKGHVRHFFDLEEITLLLREAWAIQDLRSLRAHYLTEAEPIGGIIKALAIRK